MKNQNRPEYKLYHKNIGFPREIQELLDKAKKTGYKMGLHYGTHAKKSAQTDHNGIIDLPRVLNCADCIPIEIGVNRGILDKVVFRVEYNNKFDLCLVVGAGDNFVRTVWLNDCTDNHKTLDTSKYCRP